MKLTKVISPVRKPQHSTANIASISGLGAVGTYLDAAGLATKEQCFPDLPGEFFPWTCPPDLNKTLCFSETLGNNNREGFGKTEDRMLNNILNVSA